MPSEPNRRSIRDEVTLPRGSAVPGRVLRAGAVLGRYVAVRFIGAGGSGEVWAAYDQVLRRTVALKLLHDAEADDRGWAALLAEAQSLAQLSHPSVVSLHDIGRHEGLVFLSMELVDGTDLTRWLADTQRPWRERLAVLIEAGRGLAAAHDAGIVHGDFKPANVLVDGSGTPRVVDFGLAGIERSRALGEPGTAPGTPSYMAPELHGGHGSSFASDQYAFAVATVEALISEKPAASDIRAGLATAGLPPSVRPMLLRALSPEPDARWPSVSGLLGALEVAARPRRRLAPWAVLGTIALAGAAWVAVQGGDKPCEGLDAELHDVWDSDRRDALAGAFAQSTAPWAGDVAATTLAKLDGQARAWVDARTAVCEQRRVAGGQQDAYALRRFCLGATRAAVVTATDLLIAGDDELLERAVEVVEGIPEASDCLDVELRTPRVHKPTATQLAQIEGIQAELGRLDVLRAAGRYAEALDQAEALVVTALAAEDLHDAAKAQLQVGDLLRRLDRPNASEARHRAVSMGLSAGRNDVIAQAAVLIAWEAADQSELQTARAWVRHAEAAADAAGRDEQLTVRIANTRAQVHRAAGEREAGLLAAQDAVTAAEPAFGPDSAKMAAVLNTLAVALYRDGQFAEAQVPAERALHIVETLLGSRHPRWPPLALTLAAVRLSQGHHAAAGELLARAHAIALETMGPEHPSTLTIQSGLAAARAAAGEFGEAARLHRSELTARLAHDGEETAETAMSRLNLGIALHRSGELQEAASQLEQSAAFLAEVLGGSHPDALFARAALADVRVDLGDTVRAIPQLETLLVDAKDDTPVLSTTRFALARARWALHPGSPQALALATQARDAFAELDYASTVDTIDAWLEQATIESVLQGHVGE